MYMQMNANSWVFLNAGTILACLIAPNYDVLGRLFVGYNLFYACLFIFILSKNATYGFQTLPFLIFLLLCSFTAGGVAIGLLL